MILDLAFTSKSYYASNQVRSGPTYLSGLEAIDLPTKRLLSF